MARRFLGAALLLTTPAAAQETYREAFDSRDLSAWAVTSKNDFNERSVEVSNDARLRIRADTMGTGDDTVKFLGARLRRPVEIGDGICLATTLDWNDQANGSYLTAALVLAAEETNENPLDLEDWLAVEYVGVPPGRNARLQIRERREGRSRTLEDEGWPEEQRTGRKIEKVRIMLELSPAKLRMWENGVLLHEGEPDPLPSHVFFYLQLSTHSNYRAREVYFDQVEMSPGRCGDGVVFAEGGPEG